MNQTDKAFQEAYEIFRKGNPAGAYEAFRALLPVYPHKGELHWYLAMAALQGGHPQQALEHMDQALFFEPGNANYISEMGVVHFHLKNREMSLYHMDKALELEPDNPYRYSSRAYIRSSFGMVEEAIADYEKAVALDPEDSVAYNNLGLLQEQTGWNEKARMNYRQADALEGLKNALMQEAEAGEEFAGPLPAQQPGSTAESPAEDTPRRGMWQIVADIFGKAETRREFFDFWKGKVAGK